MTQIAEPQPEVASAGLDRVNHWINGARVPGTSGRSGPVYNPATGQVARQVDFASVGGGRRSSRRGARGVPGVARDEHQQADGDHVPRPQPRRAAPRGNRRAPDPGARQGAIRRPGRGRARPREPRVRDRHPAPDQGRVHRAGQHRHRRLPDPPATGRGGGHHAVQLPRHGADVDVRQRHRLRQHLHPEAVREGPLGIGLPRRAAEGGGRAGRRLQRRPRRQGGGRPRSSSTPTSSRSHSSAQRRSRDTSTRRAPRTASASRHSVGRRTT